MPRWLIPCRFKQAPLSPNANAEEKAIEYTKIEPDVDIDSEPEQVPNIEDTYSVDTCDKLG